MRNQNRLTDPQQRLLRAMRDGLVLVPQLLKQLQITPQRLARWMRRDFFRDSLGEMKLEIRRMQWLDIELLAKSAVATLQQMLVKPSKRDFMVLLLCLAILLEYDRAWKRLRRGKGPKRGKRKRGEEPKTLCHADSQDRDDYLLKQLEALD